MQFFTLNTYVLQIKDFILTIHFVVSEEKILKGQQMTNDAKSLAIAFMRAKISEHMVTIYWINFVIGVHFLVGRARSNKVKIFSCRIKDLFSSKKAELNFIMMYKYLNLLHNSIVLFTLSYVLPLRYYDPHHS